MKNTFLITGLLLLSIRLSAQNSAQQGLNPGDHCPDILMSSMINYPNKTAKLSDFKGKLVILDFWGVWCGGCIDEMPLLDSLQNEFGNKIQIILVTHDTEAQVRNLMKHSKIVAKTKLPMVVADTGLGNRFLPREPHCAWIKPNGDVLTITDSYNITENHIRTILQGGQISFSLLPQKIEGDASTSIFQAANTQFLHQLKQYSYFTGRMKNFNGSGGPRLDSVTGKVYKIELFNMSILDLYKIAYGGLFSSENIFGIEMDRARVKIECKDKQSVEGTNNHDLIDKWKDKNAYCYELMVPPSKSDQMQSMMQQDLNRYFDVKGSVEKIKTKCLVLIAIGNTKNLRTKGWDEPVSSNASNEVIFKNKPIRDIANELEYFLGFKTPVVDQTGISSNIDITLQSSNFNNLASAKAELRKHGLDLVEKYTDVDMLVLHDKK